MPMTPKNTLVLVAYGNPVDNTNDKIHQLAQSLAKSLAIPVDTAFLDGSPSVGEAIQMSVLQHRSDKLVVLPIFYGASPSKLKNLDLIISAANQRGFSASVHLGKALNIQASVIAAYQAILSDYLKAYTASIPVENTALLLVTRGSRDSESNAQAYYMGRLLYENTGLKFFDLAFDGFAKPDIATAIDACIQRASRRILILPFTLFDNKLRQTIEISVQSAQGDYPDIEINVLPELEINTPSIISTIMQLYQSALDDDETILSIPHSHGDDSLGQHSIMNILPPRYHNVINISSSPMGAAGLIYDADGRVAWAEIWGNFCDLALAGGPPHRGSLLEPVSPQSVIDAPDAYRLVLEELARGITMITGLAVITDASPGWIGVQCDDEDMALWLLRAIVVENISVRRENNVLYFPAGAHFRLEHEIKNIITVIAKTHHYWTEHIGS